mmetsp:Transcript_81672/g.122680  ORF Transcript_81672/g.122680 Transcript_81672/m.122680 type:complete len:100 (-) Transcript_81672:478-777(-)
MPSDIAPGIVSKILSHRYMASGLKASTTSWSDVSAPPKYKGIRQTKDAFMIAMQNPSNMRLFATEEAEAALAFVLVSPQRSDAELSIERFVVYSSIGAT